MSPELKQAGEFVVFVILAVGAVVWSHANISKRLDDIEAAIIRRIEGDPPPEPPAK